MTLAVVAAIPGGPTAVLTVDDPYPAVGQAVHFNASASTGHDWGNGRIVGYTFSFGDGFGTDWGSAPSAEHAYAAAGRYTAKVTVVDGRGEESTASVVVAAGTSPPPPSQAPDLVPIQAQLTPARPRVNDSVNVTVVVLNLGSTAGTATVDVSDSKDNATPVPVGSAQLSGPLGPSATASVTIGPFVVATAGNHTLRIVVTNVTPTETSSAGHELDVPFTVYPTSPSGSPGGPPFALTPLAVGLGAAAVAAAIGAGLLFLRPRPPGPLEPPPASPPDRSPPPIWPP